MVLCEGQGVAPDLGFKGTSEGGLYNEVINQERFSPGPVLGDYYSNSITIFYKGIMPSEKILDFPVDCNFLTGSVNL